ncbi:helix-turn-helix transcriptional regulator [Rhodococcus olei]|uniref:helix-turn-helix transcriptional regulator n=1 Tax=Rhodococcus olei TaxID=2161675 RepID=UPI0031E91833
MAADRGERLVREVVRVTHRGLGLDELREQFDGVVRGFVPWDVAAWSTTDPATLLFTSCVLSGRAEDPDAEARLFDSEFRVPDVNTFADLARSNPPVGTLHAATGGRLDRSARWRTILGPIGVTDEIRAAFLDGSSCWGTLVAYRMGGAPFTPDDVALLARIGPLVADGLRRAMLHTAADHAVDAVASPGIAIVEPDGTLGDVTPQAQRWLADIAEEDTVPSVFRAVAAAARSAADGAGDRPAHARLARRGGGWILVHGSVLTSSGRVAVILEAATENHLSDVLVRAYGLTPREREITELVLRGASTDAIAKALFISAYTVQDHVKSILAKAEIPSRRDLVAALYGRHYAPLTAAGAIPSPYGWYLGA